MSLLPPVIWCLAINHQFINLIWQIMTMASFPPSYKIYQLNAWQALPFTSPSCDTENDFYFGHWMNAYVKFQLKKLGVMPPEQPLPVKCNRIYQIMWANNGDAISRQYAGTAALKVWGERASPALRNGWCALENPGKFKSLSAILCGFVLERWGFAVEECFVTLGVSGRRAECSLHFTCILFPSCLGTKHSRAESLTDILIITSIYILSWV